MARMSVGILSWFGAQSKLGRKDSVKIGHNTWLERRFLTSEEYKKYGGYHEAFVIRYHQTDIITIMPDNTYILSSGGWLTSTTKERIAKLAPGRLYQKYLQWFVGEHYPHGAPFYDGIVVDANGKVVE